ncbi:MAG: FeoB-associated Cys-rich membrane protein [Clostridiales bacterium]|nr:FeoB-associated Cys-rich membrane protein [Clostridiales bacterium]
MNCIVENLSTIIVGVLVLALLTVIVRGTLKSRKAGGACANCAGCARANSCGEANI